MSDVKGLIRELIMPDVESSNRRELADSMGISYDTLYSIQHRPRGIRSDTMDLILEYYGKHMVIVDD